MHISVLKSYRHVPAVCRCKPKLLIPLLHYCIFKMSVTKYCIDYGRTTRTNEIFGIHLEIRSGQLPFLSCITHGDKKVG